MLQLQLQLLFRAAIADGPDDQTSQRALLDRRSMGAVPVQVLVGVRWFSVDGGDKLPIYYRLSYIESRRLMPRIPEKAYKPLDL